MLINVDQCTKKLRGLIADDGGAIVPMFANHIHAVSKTIAHGDNVAGNWSSDGGKFAERWWKA